jgi:hypothetical protein
MWTRKAGHITGIGEVRNAYTISIGKLKVTDHSGDTVVVQWVVLQ